MAFKLEANEHVILIARRHWFRPVLQTIALFFSLLIPLLITSVAFAAPDLAAELGNVGILSVIFMLFWFFLIWNIAFIIWTNHFLDVVVITNMHIIDIEQIGLWHREISTLNLEKIQDISSKTEGLIASLLQYGDLEIQTAGSMTNFIVKSVQQPDLIRQKINEQIVLLSSVRI
jgi:uncharacterized membrane protein YdbT with pleckstrin-like domain